MLCKVLPHQYLDHFILLVASMHILSAERITHFEVQLADRFLHKFYASMASLYGESLASSRCLLSPVQFYYPPPPPHTHTHTIYLFKGATSCKMNFHLMSHLASCVSSWGPVWSYSCFPFESMNGLLKLFFHGTKNMSEQVSIH